MYREDDDMPRHSVGFDQYGNPYGFNRGVDVYYLYDGKHYTENELIEFAETMAHYDAQDSGEHFGIVDIDDAIEFLGEDEVEVIDAYGRGGEISKKKMLDYLNMYFDYYDELRTIAVEEDNILTREMLPSLTDLQIELAYDDAKYEIKADTHYADGGMMAKDGNIPTIEKRVAQVNELIKEGNEKGLEVVDNTTTWQSPMKYKPLKYSNGVLYIEYEELDLYKYNRREGTKWNTKKERIGKSGMGLDDQKYTLSLIARMYRSAINHFDKYGYADGGYMAKGGMPTFEDKVDAISKSLLKRKKVSPSVQKDYGKTYSKSEAIDSAKRIAGAMKKKS